MTSVLLDTNAPQVGAVILAAKTLMLACEELNSQVMLAGDSKLYADATVLGIALQATLDAGIRQEMPGSHLFTALATLNAAFVRHQDRVPPEQAINLLVRCTKMALEIGKAAPTYDLSAGGHA